MSNLKPLPNTKDGFRYNYCEDDEPLCSRYIKEINLCEPNKRIVHPFIKRKVIPNEVRLSETDRAPQLKVDNNNTRVTGEKGYSMARATHGVNRGKYYFEVHIDKMPENTATRIGWGQYYSNLQAPLGYDHYGYSWRSRFGTKFHQARGKTFDKDGGYGEGDTIGCMIELPYANPRQQTLSHHLPQSIKTTGSCLTQHKKKDPVWKVMEEKDDPPSMSSMTTLVGSKISFYKNGKFVGVAFEDIFSGSYYPTISLYKSCTVSVNFGPKFRYPPEKYNSSSKNHINYKPAQDMAQVSIIDNFLSDLIYIVDQENQPEGKNNLDDMIKRALNSQ